MTSTFRAATRTATVTLLEGYKTLHDEALKQIYRGRPASIYTPCAFPEGIDEPDINYTAHMVQRNPRVSVRIVHGSFDSAEAVDQQDAFIDGFFSYVQDNRHAAGGRTLLAVVSIQDEPGWVPEWLPVEQQRSYYSSVVVLEGSILEGD